MPTEFFTGAQQNRLAAPGGTSTCHLNTGGGHFSLDADPGDPSAKRLDQATGHSAKPRFRGTQLTILLGVLAGSAAGPAAPNEHLAGEKIVLVCSSQLP